MLYLTLILVMLYFTHDTRHWYLPWYIWPMISDTGTCHAIPDPDIWHRYLPCYTWYLISDTGTCHAILDTWYITPILDILSLDLILWHLTGYCYTWHLYHMAYSWLSLLRGLGMIIILLPDLWYSWTPVPLYSWISVSPVLMSPCIVTLVNSTARPTSGRACLVSGWRGCIP